MALGGAKGGGGKGQGAEEREEECSICQSEFTVRGDGGECCCVVIAKSGEILSQCVFINISDLLTPQ